MTRGQYPRGEDMAARFAELVEQARLADQLGFASLTKGSHYSAHPYQDFQQLPFLARMSAEAPRLDRKRVVSGKSVSVRVDLGGRRIIKKKKKDVLRKNTLIH